MNTIFEVPGCPVCAEVEPAVLFANLNLPPEDQITLTNTHLGSSEIKFLNLFSEDKNYFLPDGFITKIVNVRGNEVPWTIRVMGSSSTELNEDILLGIKRMSNFE